MPATAVKQKRLVLKSATSDLADAADPKKALFDMVGDLSGVRVMSARMLVGMYIRPRLQQYGSLQLQRTDKDIQEDDWQGNVGLVLKKGPIAFKDDETHKYHGQDIEVGEWVIFRPGDARRVQINGVNCRYVEDGLVDSVTDDPTIVTHFQSKA